MGRETMRNEKVLPWREGRLAIFQAMILLGALVLVFPGYFFRGETIAPTIALRDVQPWLGASGGTPEGIPMRLMSDVITFFIPQYSLVQRSFSQGEWPLWNPYQFGGMPLLANCQSAVFLPPRMLLAWLPLEVAVSCFILLKLWLCGMAAWLTARQLRLGVPAASLYSLMWLAAPYCLLWSYWSLTDVAIAFPITFLGAERCLRDSRSISGPAFFGAGVAWMLLAGHPETAFAFCWVLGVYVFLRLVWNPGVGEGVIRPVVGLAIASVIALGLTAVQWLPFLEYLLHSSTFFERQNEERFYYGLTSLVCVAFPRFLGSFAEKNYWGNINSHVEMMLYAGTVALIALPLAFQNAWTRVRERSPDAIMTLALAVGAVVSAVASLDMGAMAWLNRLPMFRSMLWCYHAVFLIFALPLLGALGLDRLFSGRISPRHVGVCLAWGAAWLMFAVGCYWFHHAVLRMAGEDAVVRREVIIGTGWLMLSLALIGLASLARGLGWRGGWLERILPVLFGLVVVLDATRALRLELPTSPKRWFYPETALVQRLKQLEFPVRVGLSEGGIVAGVLTPAGVMDWVGYDGLYPGRMWRFQRALGPEFWDAMEPAASIAWFVNDPRYPPIMPESAYQRMERVALLDGLELLRDPKALPWARLVYRVETEPDLEHQYIRMKTPGFDPGRVALVEAFPPEWPGMPEAAVPSDGGEARILRYAMNNVVVATESDTPALLVTADAWFPGWKACVDGKPAPVIPAYTVFRSVPLPAGKHQVEFRYAPVSWQAGMAISLCVSCGMVIMGCVMVARRLRKAIRVPILRQG